MSLVLLRYNMESVAWPREGKDRETVCGGVYVDWLPEEQRRCRTARRLLGNVCVTGVTQARQIHRAAVTDTFLARADLQTHSLPRSPFSHFGALTLLPLSRSQMLSVSLVPTDFSTSVKKHFYFVFQFFKAAHQCWKWWGAQINRQKCSWKA